MFSTTRWIKLIKNKKFIVTAFDLDYKNFIIYIATFYISFDLNAKVNFSKKAQITYIKVNKAFIEVFSKYGDFVNIFSFNCYITPRTH